MEDIILIIVLYVIGTLAADQANRKKRRKKREDGERQPDFDAPPSRNDNPFDFEIPPIKTKNPNDFEIPKIENASQKNSNANTIYREEPKPNKYQKYLNERKKTTPHEETSNTPITIGEIGKERITMSKERVREGIVLAEILGKPKAYGRR